MSVSEQDKEVKRLLLRCEELRNAGASQSLLMDIGLFCKRDAFGWGQGQLRPGHLGQWDLYFTLFQDFRHTKAEAAAGAGLSLKEIGEEEHREEMRSHGWSPEEQKEYDYLKSLSPEELDNRIAELEKLLEE